MVKMKVASIKPTASGGSSCCAAGGRGTDPLPASSTARCRLWVRAGQRSLSKDPILNATYPLLSSPRRWVSARTGLGRPPPARWGPLVAPPGCPGTRGSTWSGYSAAAAARPGGKNPVNSPLIPLGHLAPPRPAFSPSPARTSKTPKRAPLEMLLVSGSWGVS